MFHYGTPRDIPVVGDWNGDGTDTIAVFSGGTWYQDVDGDGKWTQADTTYAIRRSGRRAGRRRLQRRRQSTRSASIADGVFYLDTNGNGKLDGQDEVIQLGEAGDVPVVGDWDGDGREEVGVYRDGEIAQVTARKAS